MTERKPTAAIVCGDGRLTSRAALAALIAGIGLEVVAAETGVRTIQTRDLPDLMEPQATWLRDDRKRAQWKDETNKRGRSR